MKFSVYILALAAAAALAADDNNNNNNNDNNDKSTATTGQKSAQSQASKTGQQSASATQKDDKSSTKSADDSKTTNSSDNKSQSKSDNKSGDSKSDSKSGDSKSGDNKSGDNKSQSGDKSSQKSSEKSSEKSTTTSSISIDPRLPAGGINLMTPEVTSSTYIKLGEQATFVWNFTSLSVTPTALNIEAYCSQNRHYYTIAANQSAQETSVIWDTGKYSNNETDDTPLINSNYQLYIYDADQDMNAVASAGYLASFNRYQFGIYSPQPYVPMDQFQCNGCQGKAKNSAPGADMLVTKMLMAFCLVIVASFVHFTI